MSAALRRAELNNLIAPARAAIALDRLMTAPVHRVQVRPLLADAWAKRSNMTIADGIYVALADHLRGTLVTGDVKLANSPELNVSTINP